MADKERRARCLELVTDIIHPTTGEALIDVKAIDDILQSHSSESNKLTYGWIIHDKDKYTDADERKDPKHKKGALKAPHVHILAKFEDAQRLSTFARWFGFEGKTQFIEIKNNGAGKTSAYYECLMYLTHEKSKDKLKTVYDDSEVHFYHPDGYGFREFLEKEAKVIADNKSQYGRAEVSKKEKLRFEVLYNGLTLRQLRKEYRMEYMEDLDTLKKYRCDYLANCPPPPFRINIYIDGQGGAGKSLFSKALARAIIDPEGKMDDDDIFCHVSGSENVAFEQYEGQKVLIWDDFRSVEIFNNCSRARGNIFKVFAVNPDKTIQNKKYSSVNLINTVNIVNSVQQWKEFLDGLSGEYLDVRSGDMITSEEKEKVQSFRRFPIIVSMKEDSYDLMLNKGFFDGGDPMEWTVIPDIKAELKAMIKACGSNVKLYDKLSKAAVSKVVEAVRRAEAIMSHSQDGTDEEIMARFADVGTTKTEPPVNKEFPPKKDDDSSLEGETESNEYYEGKWDADVGAKLPF